MRVNGVGPGGGIAIIGPWPGSREEETGIPFSPGRESWSGRKWITAGDELNRFLESIGLDRDDIYLDNLYQDYKGKEYEYSAEEYALAAPALLKRLYHKKIEVIVAMGREVSRLFLGDVDIIDVESLAWEVYQCHDCRHIAPASAERERLLAVDRKTETGRTRASEHILRRKTVEGAQSSLHNASRPDSGGEDSGPHVQSYVVSESNSRRGINPTTQYGSRKTTTNTLLERASAGVVSVAKESRQQSTSAWNQKPVLSRMCKSGISPELGEAQGPVQRCKACGSTNTRSLVVLCMVHVAAGMRNHDMSPLVVKGFQALQAFLNGSIEPRKLFDDPYPEPHYEEITTESRLQEVTSHWQDGALVSTDTEGWPGNPWSLQFSTEPGTAYLIRGTRQDLLRAFHRHCLGRGTPVRLLFYSALHDLAVGRSLGIDFSEFEFEDTAVQAYLLQLEPKGLKAGCLRNCNMAMSSYDDVMGDVSNELARQYLTWLYESEQVEYEEKQQAELVRLQTTPYTDKKGNVHPGRRVSKLPSLPKTGLHKAVSRCLQSPRPRGLWEDQIEDIQVAGYHRLGAVPEPTLDYVEPSIAIPYGCRDADGTGRLRGEYGPRIDAAGLRDVYQLELGTYPLIDRMAKVGLKPDLEHFEQLSALLQTEIDRLQESLAAQTARADFNANSGDQVAAYLFGTLNLEEIKMTSGGRGSTNDKILEALENEHPEYPVISDIRAYRETYKLKHTFVDRIPDFVDRWPYDGRVHSTFRTTTVVTGRLAASDPNVLAQPEHGVFAPYFKMGWVADEGHVICAWDESQIELRGLAHLSQDPLMLAVFRGEKRNPDGSLIDLHAALAERIFGVKPKDQDKHKHRLPAKSINFGIPMGLTCRGLSVELRKNGVDADEETAQQWLDETLALYTGVADYMEQRKEEARRNGFVRCLSGRIRYIGGIRSRDDRVREEAERFAFSTPIQESATLIMKQAEITVWNEVLPYFWKRGKWVEPLLQVHDCLKMECQTDVAQELHIYMREAMTNVPKGFSVPLAVDGEFGPDMFNVEKFK